ncbi:MAG: hypothetical protein ACRDY3_06835 [Acidimicrobiales bacterium]
MTDSHKAALAKGREEGRIVRAYLEALESTRPRRGRKRTVDSIRKKLAGIEQELSTASPLNRLHLVQEQRDLEAELAHSGQSVDVSALEKEFIRVAKDYSGRKGLSYSAWRAVGVSAAVLDKAGIPRTRS